MGRPTQDNNRVKITTTLNKELLKLAKIRAVEEEVEGVNAIIEKALEMYLKKEQ
jgi:hypothetical protein